MTYQWQGTKLVQNLTWVFSRSSFICVRAVSACYWCNKSCTLRIHNAIQGNDMNWAKFNSYPWFKLISAFQHLPLLKMETEINAYSTDCTKEMRAKKFNEFQDILPLFGLWGICKTSVVLRLRKCWTYLQKLGQKKLWRNFSKRFFPGS